MWISPSYQDSDFQYPLGVDDKITIFEDRVLGWKLDIADRVINGRSSPESGEERPPIPHSGYATLDIIFSYFEMIAKYEDGYTQARQSEEYFKAGVYSVFPQMKSYQVQGNIPGVQGKVVSVIDYVLDLMYDGVRCGLYHSGATNGRVELSAGFQAPLVFDSQNIALGINPHLLVPKLRAHFMDYINRLRDPNNSDLRRKFEARFDFDTRV
jgi:hypothetical protein